MKEIRDNIPKD